MDRLGDLDLRAHLSDPSRKQAFVTPMFDLVAPRYDEFTRVFSFGMDARWKGALIADATSGLKVNVAVDVACGTGDLALRVARAADSAHVTGVDPAAEMLARAAVRARVAGLDSRVTFSSGHADDLPFDSGSVDLVTAGYCFRNTPSFESALSESARVLRVGGRLAVLDFYRPASAAWRELFLAYLRLAGNAVGWWWHREPVAYGYIAPSIRSFVTRDAFTALLGRHGFRDIAVRSYLGGGVATHVATRR